MKIKISNPETNQNSLKIELTDLAPDDPQSIILLPGTSQEVELYTIVTMYEVKSLIYVEKELTGPMGRQIEVK